MKTSLDCVPCFFKQALDAAQFAGAGPSTQKKILHQLSREILNFDLDLCPSHMGRVLYALVRRVTGKNDPFKKIKQRSNKFALELYPRLKQKVRNAQDRLLMVTELAIAGNIIDYGVKNGLNSPEAIEKVLAKGERIIRRESKSIFDYQCFKKALRKAKKILYLADNAGEVVFDRVFIEQLRNKEIIYVVRGGPIINDALEEDAIFCGLNRLARIVSSGCDAPGVILSLCTQRFRRIFRDAELIISKGQGNFETLSGESGPIFFLFKAKCAVLARHLSCRIGDVILRRANQNKGVAQ